VISVIDPQELPAMAGNKLYLDYISGSGSAAQFFAHSPTGFAAGRGARQDHAYPRQEVSALLAEYNTRLGAHARAMENIEAWRDPSTLCVISGQQAGFLGGPAYTLYKIVTTIRLAAHLEEAWGTRCVPVFWLATEDHDFNEINHAYYMQADGEVGRVRFDWQEEGRPIADLPVTGDVRRAYQEYMDDMSHGPHLDEVKERFAPQPGEGFALWQARTWSQLFSERGLVVLEPRLLRPVAANLFRFAIEHSGEIRERLDQVAERLVAEGYEPALTSEQAGELYTFDAGGFRVRVDDPQAHLDEVTAHPERYSTDAALRPLFADALLPVIVSVLGPGEIAYQAMLKPLYELFDLPQPVLLPRKGYTIVAQSEADRLAEYQVSAKAVLAEQLDLDAAFGNVVPASEREMFAAARRDTEAALAPLRSYLHDIDPSLVRTWEQTLANSMRNLDKLEERAFRARMSQMGFSKGDLRTLQNALLPRGRLQERVFPLPHFINRHGWQFIDEIFSAGELERFGHCVLTIEDERA
jgi:bacillithiol biosynthesis cysteine-adding enzyme BshC